MATCFRCGYFACRCYETDDKDTIDNTNEKLKEDVEAIITKITLGRYGPPENWKDLKNDLEGLYNI